MRELMPTWHASACIKDVTASCQNAKLPPAALALRALHFLRGPRRAGTAKGVRLQFTKRFGISALESETSILSSCGTHYHFAGPLREARVRGSVKQSIPGDKYVDQRAASVYGRRSEDPVAGNVGLMVYGVLRGVREICDTGRGFWPGWGFSF